MKRFTHEKSYSHIKQIVVLLLFLIVFILFVAALSKVSAKTYEQRANTLKQSISRNIAHYYATEGVYPESFEQLTKRYGIYYDANEFFVDYQTLGENIFPDVTIISKQEER